MIRVASCSVLAGRSPSNTMKSRIDRSELQLSQKLIRTKFVFRGQTFSGARIDRCGYLRLDMRKTRVVRLSELKGIFVGLGFNRNIVGFGLTLNARRHQLSIRSSVRYFNEIHLSTCGIRKKRQSNRIQNNRLNSRILTAKRLPSWLFIAQQTSFPNISHWFII
jgi:polynucleotide 5'-kinase involved in rRNA processing